MYIKSFLTTLAVLAGTANAAAGVQLESRAPKDKSGNSQMIYTCDEVILPNPGGAGGAGEGGSGSFSDSFKFIDRDGATIEATACETINGYCTNCLFNSKYLSSPTNVTGVSTICYKTSLFHLNHRLPLAAAPALVHSSADISC